MRVLHLYLKCPIVFVSFTWISCISTFILGPYYLQSYSKCRYTIGFDKHAQGFLLPHGSLVYLVHPGLSGADGTSSIQPYDRPHFHMFDDGDYLDIADRLDLSNLNGFESDATFQIKWDEWEKGAFSMESVTRNEYFVSHMDNLRLRLMQYDGTQQFREEASFRTIQGEKLAGR